MACILFESRNFNGPVFSIHLPSQHVRCKISNDTMVYIHITWLSCARHLTVFFFSSYFSIISLFSYLRRQKITHHAVFHADAHSNSQNICLNVYFALNLINLSSLASISLARCYFLFSLFLLFFRSLAVTSSIAWLISSLRVAHWNIYAKKEEREEVYIAHEWTNKRASKCSGTRNKRTERFREAEAPQNETHLHSLVFSPIQ